MIVVGCTKKMNVRDHTTIRRQEKSTSDTDNKNVELSSTGIETDCDIVLTSRTRSMIRHKKLKIVIRRE